MCEIFFMVSAKNEKLSKEHITKFLNACLPASSSNNDGWGAFWERSDYHGSIKSPSTFRESDIPKILERYRGSRFFALHLRKATSEICYKNTHPFNIGEFRGCHNGVVRVPEHNGESDSADMFQLISKKEGTITDKIASAMPQISGTYSVFLHSFKDNKLYYYRNTPSFGFMLDKTNGLIYGATQIDRLKVLVPKVFGIFSESIIAKPREKVVYAIDLNTGNFTEETVITEEVHYHINMKNDWHTRVYGGSKYDSDCGGV